MPFHTRGTYTAAELLLDLAREVEISDDDMQAAVELQRLTAPLLPPIRVRRIAPGHAVIVGPRM